MDWAQFFTPSVLAPGALVGMCVLMILTGQLVTKNRLPAPNSSRTLKSPTSGPR